MTLVALVKDLAAVTAYHVSATSTLQPPATALGAPRAVLSARMPLVPAAKHLLSFIKLNVYNSALIKPTKMAPHVSPATPPALSVTPPTAPNAPKTLSIF